MASHPALVYALVAFQVIFIAFDLLSPFLSPLFASQGTIDFLMAYFLGVLDFILLLGFLWGSKWAYLYSLLYNGFNIVTYIYSFSVTPYPYYIVLMIMRIAVLVLLRVPSVRMHFKVTRTSSYKTSDSKKSNPKASQ